MTLRKQLPLVAAAVLVQWPLWDHGGRKIARSVYVKPRLALQRGTRSVPRLIPSMGAYKGSEMVGRLVSFVGISVAGVGENTGGAAFGQVIRLIR
jgi:hypothetical protein